MVFQTGSVPKMRCGNCGDGGDKRRTASRLGDVMKRPKRVLCFDVFCPVSRIPNVDRPLGRSRHVRRGELADRSEKLSQSKIAD